MGIVAVFFLEIIIQPSNFRMFLKQSQKIIQNFSTAERKLLRHRFLYLRQVLPMITTGKGKAGKKKMDNGHYNCLVT